MKLIPSPFFSKPIQWLDRINPVIVLISIAGLLLEFTPLRFVSFGHPTVTIRHFNSLLDVVFLIDFLVRFLAFPKRQYFFKGNGWVDFLAAIPGIMFLLEQVPGILGIFKFLRIGRFFKLIRLLRFLKVLSFLKRMKGDSAYVQERVMQIGIVIVLFGVVSIGVTDFLFERHYLKSMRTTLDTYELMSGGFDRAVSLLPTQSVLAWQQGQTYFRPIEDIISPNEYLALSHHEDSLLIRLDQHRSVIVHDLQYLHARNNLLLVLMLSIIAMLSMLVFYVGSVLAKDMALISLIVDSIDADDYLLLQDEARLLIPEGETGLVVEGEEELLSLLKMIDKLITEKLTVSTEEEVDFSEEESPEPEIEEVDDLTQVEEDLPSLPELPELEDDLPSLDEVEPLQSPEKIETISSQAAHVTPSHLELLLTNLKHEILTELTERSQSTAIQAVKISSKSIIELLKKNGLK